MGTLNSSLEQKVMGVVLGKASFDASVKPFVNLSSGAIRKLWQSFMLNADGWGVNPALWTAIAETLKDDLPIENLAEAAATLFKTMDTDQNDVVDGLELLATLVSAFLFQPPVTLPPLSF